MNVISPAALIEITPSAMDFNVIASCFFPPQALGLLFSVRLFEIEA
jgi:hypothetical protein